MEILNLYPQEILVRKNNLCTHENHLIIGKTYSRVYTYNYESYMKFDLSQVPALTNEYSGKIVLELNRLPYSNYNIMEVGCLLAPFRFDSANRYTQVATVALTRNNLHQLIEIDLSELLGKWKSGAAKNYGLVFRLNEGNTNSMAVLGNPMFKIIKEEVEHNHNMEETNELDFSIEYDEATYIQGEEESLNKMNFGDDLDKDFDISYEEGKEIQDYNCSQATPCISKTKIINSYFTAETNTQIVSEEMAIVYSINTSSCGRDITHLENTDVFILRGNHKYMIQASVNGEIQGNQMRFSIEVDNVPMAYLRACKTCDGGFVSAFGAVGVVTLNDSTLVIRNLDYNDVNNLNSSISITRLQ